MEGVPKDFFEQAWQDADHPMAAVNLKNEFVHCNHAFERLLGYSSSELRNTTWMQYTRQSHVGGDLASVQDVISGVTDSYRLEKDYIHKRGHSVSIVLTVRRYPPEAHREIALFSVEAPVATATRPEIYEVEKHTIEAIAELRRQVEEYKKGVSVHVGDHVGGDYTGRDRNESQTLRYLVAGFIAMVVVMAWLMYYVATTAGGNSNPQAPPNVIGHPPATQPSAPAIEQ